MPNWPQRGGSLARELNRSLGAVVVKEWIPLWLNDGQGRSTKRQLRDWTYHAPPALKKWVLHEVGSRRTLCKVAGSQKGRQISWWGEISICVLDEREAIPFPHHFFGGIGLPLILKFSLRYATLCWRLQLPLISAAARKDHFSTGGGWHYFRTAQFCLCNSWMTAGRKSERFRRLIRLNWMELRPPKETPRQIRLCAKADTQFRTAWPHLLSWHNCLKSKVSAKLTHQPKVVDSISSCFVVAEPLWLVWNQCLNQLSWDGNLDRLRLPVVEVWASRKRTFASFPS